MIPLDALVATFKLFVNELMRCQIDAEHVEHKMDPKGTSVDVVDHVGEVVPVAEESAQSFSIIPEIFLELKHAEDPRLGPTDRNTREDQE